MQATPSITLFSGYAARTTLGVETRDHVDPFRWSASFRRSPPAVSGRYPAAQQSLEDAQAMALRWVPNGVSAETADHFDPFHRSASLRYALLRSLEPYPTAQQLVEAVQATLER